MLLIKGGKVIALWNNRFIFVREIHLKKKGVAQAVKIFAGIKTVMQKINLILKGFSGTFNEPMTVISVISCKNTVAGVENGRLLFQLSQNKMENQVKLYLWIKNKTCFQI